MTEYAVFMKSWMDEGSSQARKLAELAHLRAIFQNIAGVAECRTDATEHLHRVSAYTRFFAERVLEWNVVDACRLEIASYMHDVGKVAVPREVLLKPGKLTEEEWAIMPQHTHHGFEIVSRLEADLLVGAVLYDERLFLFAKDIVLFHHENVDGSGYPQGLVSREIPLSARIVKIVDVLDALLNRRSYKDPWSWQQMKGEMVRLSGVQLDEKLVSALFDHEDEFIHLVNGFSPEIYAFQGIVVR